MSINEQTKTGTRVVGAPDPEVVPQAKRRRFSAEYKLRILEEADNCSQPGEIGALLRREGLYSSHLSKWRQQRAQGQLQALAPQKGGRKTSEEAKLEAELAELRRENQRLLVRLQQAEAIIDMQKNSRNYLG